MDISNIQQKNKELKNIHSGERGFVIAGGPSLMNQDLLLLDNEVTIAMNHFYRNKDCKRINPRYWVCADPDIFRCRELFLMPLLKGIETLEINTKMFFPPAGMVDMERGMFLNLHYYVYDYSKGIEEDIDFATGIPPYGQNTVIVAMMLAFFLGCNPIYIIGADFTWKTWDREEYKKDILPHCYNTFAPKLSDGMSYDAFQAATSVQDFQFLQLKKYAQKRGIQVFNATDGGNLDHFPRARYEDLFPPGTRKIDTKDLLSAIPDIASDLARSAVELMNRKEYAPALVLVDEARRHNIGKDSKVEGLDYLKAVCLTGLGEHRPAIEAARQDYHCNSSNREKTLELLRVLGDDLFPEVEAA